MSWKILITIAMVLSVVVVVVALGFREKKVLQRLDES